MMTQQGMYGQKPTGRTDPDAFGRGCIRIKRLADVDLAVIDEVVRASAATDGQAITY